MDEASSGSGQLGPMSQTVPEHMSRLRKPANPFLYPSFATPIVVGAACLPRFLVVDDDGHSMG